MGSLLILTLVVGALAGAIYFFRSKLLSYFEQKLNEIFMRVLNRATEHVINVADQKLAAEKQEIKTDLTNKKEAIEDLVKQVKDEMRQNAQKLENAERERVGSFSALKQELAGHKEITEQLKTTTEGLKKVLSNNQLRGQFGEQVAEDLLRMSGFVNGTDYVRNKAQGETSNRPDFCIFLPDGVKINVDVKFPYNNLQRMTETEDMAMKQEYLKAFGKDVKEKIKQVTTREYINPADNTVDFAILFIPNEMIFSFIYEHMNDLWGEAMRQKVIFAGPFNFTAILRLIRQSYSNFKYQKNIHKIITFIKTFEEEFKKYNEEFEKIGIRINALSEQYDKVNSTRTNQLVRTVDKIKLEEPTTELIEEPEVSIENALPDPETIN